MASVAQQVRQLTGSHTRIVWIQQQQGWEDFCAITPDFKLMGLDSDDDRGVHTILEETGSYANPILTPRGDRIVYTDNVDKSVHVVDWDGGNHRVIAPGYGVTCWKDPGTAIEWVYIRPNKEKTWFSKSRPVVRHRIDDPDTTEEMWNESSISWNWLQLSVDGTRGACSSPWPKCGMITLPRGEFTFYDKGCWTMMAPDNSYRMWVFDPDHRTVKLYDTRQKMLARIDIHEAPGVRDWEIYHPRWSNHLRFINVTGPFSKERTDECMPEDRENLIHSGGRNVELYLGRLTEDLSAVDGWVKITDNEKADFYGDTWVEGGGRS